MSRVPSWPLTLLVVSSVYAQDPALPIDSPDRPAEIEADAWFNPQPAHLYGQPRGVLLVFWSTDSAESRVLTKPLNRLHRRYDKGRLQIVALTDEDADGVERFIRRTGIRYKVGAESRSARAYKVKDIPTLFLIDTKQKRIVWRAAGVEVDPKSVREAVEELVGEPDTVNRSAQKNEEEKGDIGVFYTRVDKARETLSGIVDDILSNAPDGALVEPENLEALDAFYEENLPSDPDQPGAPSENIARDLSIGPIGQSGYGRLYKTGRLSEAAKLAIRDRFISVARDDPSGGTRLTAVHGLRRVVGQIGDPVLVDALKAMRDSEDDPSARGALEQAIDHLDPTTPQHVKAEMDRPKAFRLRRMLDESRDPASSRWSDAYAYIQGVKGRKTPELVDDYWSFPDGESEVERENAVLKRQAALGEIANRIAHGMVEDRAYLQSTLADMLSSEPDAHIRSDVAETLWNLGKRGSQGDRDTIVSLLEGQLAVEPDKYLTGPAIEVFISELRAQR